MTKLCFDKTNIVVTFQPKFCYLFFFAVGVIGKIMYQKNYNFKIYMKFGVTVLQKREK